jgi:hypothetical protein
MKVFRDLEISGSSTRFDEFLTRLEGLLANGWRRDRKVERSDEVSGIRCYAYSCEKNETRNPATLYLCARKTEFYVSNIVPREVQRLSMDEYNAILVEFHDNFISPVAAEIGFIAKLTSDDQSIEDWISAESAGKLRSFSSLANKSTGSSHPNDEERWFDFIVSIVLNREKLDTSLLRRWLIEEGRWPEDIAINLALEFGQGVRLLQYYRSHQR